VLTAGGPVCNAMGGDGERLRLASPRGGRYKPRVGLVYRGGGRCRFETRPRGAPMDFAARFDEGLGYDDFLGTYGTEEQRARWKSVHDRVALTDGQQRLLRSFVREIKVLVVAGTWCGDCVNQCPIFDHVERTAGCVKFRYFDRDAHGDLAQELAICGAPRVPSLLYLSEDGFPCGRGGDRTLSTYRWLAETQLGPACPTGLAQPPELLARVTEDWLAEFERVHLMLRLSGRLRKLHGD